MQKKILDSVPQTTKCAKQQLTSLHLLLLAFTLFRAPDGLVGGRT